jgi:hypothetical protein
MTPLTLIGLLTFIVCQANAQTSAKCNCGAIVDVNFKGKIVVYDKPNGRAIKTFRQKFKKEDYLVLTINRDSSEYFHVVFPMPCHSKMGKLDGLRRRSKSEHMQGIMDQMTHYCCTQSLD